MKRLRSLAVWLVVASLLALPVFATDISVTAANVQIGSSAQTTDGTAGASITAGQLVYLDATDNKYKLADCDLSVTAATVKGIALHAAANGQPLRIQHSGTITIGGTVTVGTIYVASATAGGIAPASDLAQNWRTTIVGVGKTSSTIELRIYASGVAVP